MKFVDVKQGTDEWLQARLCHVTASEVKNVIAYAKKPKKDAEGELYYPELEARANYRHQLVVEHLIGSQGRVDKYITPEMQWGTMNEAAARTTYMLKTGNKVTTEGFVEHDELMAGASVDGLINDDGNLEIKALTTANHLYKVVKYHDMPDEFKPQVQFQMWITDRFYCHFVGYDSRLPVGLDLFAINIERDDDYIMFLEKETRKFLQEVERDVRLFMRYLPVCQRICHHCGSVFVSKLMLCDDCHGNYTFVEKVMHPADIKLIPDDSPLKMLRAASILEKVT